jgi:hypothetical protein
MVGFKRRLTAIVGLLVAMSLGACGAPDNSTVLNNAAVEPSVGPVEQNLGPVQAPPSITRRYALQEAAQRGLIEYRIAGNGASSGESLAITMRRTTAEPIDLYIEPGTVFRPDSSAAQSMVARSFLRELAEHIAEEVAERLVDEGGTIHLADDAEHNVLIEAYCRDLELANPSAQDGFTFASVDARSATLLAAARARGLDLVATQAAIWMDRGATGEEILRHFVATALQLEQAGALVASLPRM